MLRICAQAYCLDGFLHVLKAGFQACCANLRNMTY